MKVITVGRDSQNNIVIHDRLVSRFHLQLIQREDGTRSVVDLGSSNGTFVNGVKITGETQLSSKDVIVAGETKIPWKRYLKTGTDAKSSKLWVWIAAASVALLLLAGAGWWAYNRFYAEKDEVAEAQIELLEKKDELAQLEKETDELVKKALKTQSEEDRKLAEQKLSELKTKQKEYDLLKTKFETLEKENSDNKAKATRYEKEATKERTAKEKATEELKKSQKDLDKTSAELKASENKATELETKLNSIKETVSQRQTEERNTDAKFRKLLKQLDGGQLPEVLKHAGMASGDKASLEENYYQRSLDAKKSIVNKMDKLIKDKASAKKKNQPETALSDSVIYP